MKASDGQIDASSLDLGKDIEVNVSTYYTGNVYVSSANIIDPEHSDAKLQLMRLEYDSNGLLTHYSQRKQRTTISFFSKYAQKPRSGTKKLKVALGIGNANSASRDEYDS
ncbi:MAG: hypothetical protein R3A13_02880 [Bdellovibrionota bacterium]